MKPRSDIVKKLAWTRSQWVNEVEAALGEAAILWFEAKLAKKNGRRRWARRFSSEFDRELVRRFVNIEAHPVRRRFDRRAAFDEAVVEMPGTVERLREHVEQEVGRRVRVHRGLADRDVKEFWERARETAGAVMFAEEHGRARRVRGSSLP